MDDRENGYMTAEAAFWMPGIALFLIMLIVLCSYLYQGCFLMQAAYLAAFRGSRMENSVQRQQETKEQLSALLNYQAVSFGETQQRVEVGPLAVTVVLERETPLVVAGEQLILERTQKAWYLDAVAYIRGLRFLQKEEGGS